MLLIGTSALAPLVGEGAFSVKAVFNAKGAIFFPAAQEHRDQKAEGISYEDNYKGNALAAMLTQGKIEVRFHNRFTDQAVAILIRSLLAQPELAFMKGWQVTYQGRALSVS